MNVNENDIEDFFSGTKSANDLRKVSWAVYKHVKQSGQCDNDFKLIWELGAMAIIKVIKSQANLDDFNIMTIKLISDLSKELDQRFSVIADRLEIDE